MATQEPRHHVSLEDSAKKALPDQVPQKEEAWWDPLLGTEERFTVKDLIPDKHNAGPDGHMEAEEEKNRLLSLLGELPNQQRQAFTLHVLEDYDPAEIALLQNRPESQVKADIEAARQFLKERLSGSGGPDATTVAHSATSRQ